MFNNLSLRNKFLLLLILGTIFPIVIFGIISTLNFRKHSLETADENSIKLRMESEKNLLNKVVEKGEELDNYFIEARRDLEGFVSMISERHGDLGVSNANIKNLKFTFWAFSRWPEYADKNKIKEIVNKKNFNKKYEKINDLLNVEEKKDLDDFLKILISDYDVLSEESAQGKEEYYPRFLISQEIFYKLKNITEKTLTVDNSSLFLDFMADLLNENGKNILYRGMNMIELGTTLLDNHESYINLRLGFWGYGEKGMEFIYSGKNKPYHPAVGSIGNSFYCKSKFLLIKNNLEPVWEQKGILDDNKMAVLVYPIFEEHNNKETPLLGFAEYWIDWTTFSEKFSNYNFYESEHNFLIDNQNIVISDNDGNHLGSNVYEINGEMKTLENEISKNSEGFNRFFKNGSEYYVFYKTVPEASLKLLSIVSADNFISIAENEKSSAFVHIREMINRNLLSAGMLILFIFILSFYFSNTIVAPIVELNEATKKIGEGNLDIKIRPKSNDEIGQLTIGYNKMTADLKKTRNNLKKYNESLENVIAERTSELENSKKKLEQKLYESEIYSKITTDRELKMIELKKEINSLKKKYEKQI